MLPAMAATVTTASPRPRATIAALHQATRAAPAASGENAAATATTRATGTGLDRRSHSARHAGGHVCPVQHEAMVVPQNDLGESAERDREHQRAPVGQARTPRGDPRLVPHHEPTLRGQAGGGPPTKVDALRYFRRGECGHQADAPPAPGPRA
jgi:hypothetical protein